MEKRTTPLFTGQVACQSRPPSDCAADRKNVDFLLELTPVVDAAKWQLLTTILLAANSADYVHNGTSARGHDNF